MTDKDTAALERVVEGGKPVLINGKQALACSCGVRFTEDDADFIAEHREHFDHLAPDYVAPTVIA